MLRQVIVLEKGRYTKAADLSLMEREAMDTMYEAGSLMTSQNAGARRSGIPIPYRPFPDGSPGPTATF